MSAGPVGEVEVSGEKVNFDKMCMYEFFSEYNSTTDPSTGETVLKKRKKPAVVIPTPIVKASIDDEMWCYQMLMMYTPFRSHADVLTLPTSRCLCTPVDYEYVAPPEEVPVREPTLEETQAVVDAPADEPDLEVLFDDDVAASENDDATGDRTINTRIATEALSSTIIDLDRTIDSIQQHTYTAVELFKIVAGKEEQYWPKKYCDNSTILEAIEAVVKSTVLDSGDTDHIPTPGEIQELLRARGIDEPELMNLEELMTKTAMEFNMKNKSNLVDAPLDGYCCSRTYKDDVDRQLQACKKAVQPRLTAEQRQERSIADGVHCLLDYRNDLKYKLGKFRTMAVRQRAFICTVLDASEDALKAEAGEMITPRTCHCILQGEAGTGKTHLLRAAVQICCEVLGPNSVRVCAPTAHAAKAYSDCGCLATTFHRMFAKDARIEASSSRGQVSLIGDKLAEWTVMMKGVKVIIVDEMSMLSPADIWLMNTRLRDAYAPTTREVRQISCC